MAGTITTLRVTTEILITTSGELDNTGGTIGTLLQEMMELVNGFRSFWEGAAASVYLTKFNALQDDIERMLAMISEHAADLETMAQNYQEAENANAELAQGLAEDLVAQAA